MNIYHVRQEIRTKSIFDLPLRVVYYARVSTDKQEQRNSIENQKKYFEDFIKENKQWRFCGGYVDDGISGMHVEKREEFQRMLSDARSGRFDFIVTKEISRFARNTLDSIQYTRELLSCGVCIWFQNDGINTIDDDSEFRLTIMAGVAQDEIRKLSSRVRFGHSQAIKNGVVLGNSMMYGYDKKDGRLFINKEEAEMVKIIFEKYATGTWSTPKIEKFLYDHGYRNSKGEKINRRVIGNIITNPKYKGYYAGGKVKIVDMFTKKQEFLPENEWNMFKDDGSRVPAIVDEETWEKANIIFKKRGSAIKSHRTSFKTNNLFTGKIFCGNDGAPYWMKQHYIRGKEDVRWVCSYRIKNGADSCSSFGIAESELKAMIARLIQSSEFDLDDCIKSYMNLFEQIANQNYEVNDLEDLQKKKSDIEKKKQKILDYNLDGLITDEEFALKSREYQMQLDRLSNLIAQQNKQFPGCEQVEFRLKKIKEQLDKFNGIIPSDIGYEVVQELIEKISVYPIGDKKAKVTVQLKSGRVKDEWIGFPLSCSENTIFNVFPEQHTVFYRNLRSFDGHKMPVEYIFSLLA